MSEAVTLMNRISAAAAIAAALAFSARLIIPSNQADPSSSVPTWPSNVPQSDANVNADAVAAAGSATIKTNEVVVDQEVIRKQEEERQQREALEHQERIRQSTVATKEIGRIVEPREVGPRYRMGILITDVGIKFETGIYRGDEINFGKITSIDLHEMTFFNSPTDYSIIINGKGRHGGDIRREFDCDQDKNLCTRYHQMLISALEIWRSRYADL